MEIRARCKYDFVSVKALMHLSLFGKHEPKKRFRLWTIIFSALMAIAILGIIFFRDATFVMLLCAGIIIILLECYLYFLLPKIRYKAMANMKEVENVYIFSDNVLKISAESKEYNGESIIEYSLFVKAFETSKYFFLFQTNNQAFVVDKSTIEGGTAEDIRNKLSAFIKDKYFICKY